MANKAELFRAKLQSFVARSSIGASTVRNQIKPGVINDIRNYLANIDLSRYSVPSQEAFEKALSSDTLKLKSIITKSADLNWGTARKCMNIFLRDALYNHYLRSRYNLSKLENWLEVPMDSKVALALLKEAGKAEKLPVWPGVKNLTPEANRQYQAFAAKLALARQVARVHLDIEFWNS